MDNMIGYRGQRPHRYASRWGRRLSPRAANPRLPLRHPRLCLRANGSRPIQARTRLANRIFRCSSPARTINQSASGRHPKRPWRHPGFVYHTGPSSGW